MYLSLKVNMSYRKIPIFIYYRFNILIINIQIFLYNKNKFDKLHYQKIRKKSL